MKNAGPSIHVSFRLIEEAVHFITLSPGQSPGTEWEVVSDTPNQDLENRIGCWMEHYCTGTPIPLAVPINLSDVAPFTFTVLEALQKIPFGKTLSYKELAVKIGQPRAARAVGGACGRNPFPLLIPCHRVLASSGLLGGFSCGLELKKQLLLHEGNF